MDTNIEGPTSNIRRYSFHRDFLRILVLAIAYFLAHGISFFFPDTKNVILLIWPAGGIGLAAFLLNRRKLWPYLALAFFIAGISASVFLADRTFLTSFGFMVANMIESISCALLILYVSNDFQKFEKVKEVLALIAGTLLINAVTACIGALTAVMTTGAAFGESWWSWYISDGLGILLVGPFLVSWLNKIRESIFSLNLKLIIEGIAFLMVWTVLFYFIFYQFKNTLSFVVKPYMLVALIAWPAIRVGIKGVSLALLILFVASLFSPAIVNGPSTWHSANIDMNGRLLELQLFLVFLAIVGYLISAGYAGLTVSERAFQQSEHKYKALFNANTDGITIFSLKGDEMPTEILDMNENAAKMLGYSVQKMKLINPADLELNVTKEKMDKRIEELKSVGFSNFETSLRHKDGHEVYAEIKVLIAFYAGRPILMNIARDITKRKSDELELLKAKEKAEESERLKSAFLANMSHEVRTPLNSIIGFSELLADPDYDEESKHEFIQHIIANGNSLLTIISDIMDISKMESHEITIRNTRINVQEFISTIKEQFDSQAAAKNIDFKLIIPENDDNPVIIADPDRLLQIFNNLVGNAIKFTDKGAIEISYHHRDKFIEFQISDTGIGISDEFHDKIFERFRQVETSLSRKYGGNGLGLPISKNLVELMSGQIWLESKPGKGSVFHFTLPIEDKTKSVG